jgi:hypothetical protein
MRNGILRLTAALLAALVFGEAGRAQSPGPKRGPRGGLEPVLDELKLSEGKKETAREAVRQCQDNIRRLTGLASAELMMKLKEVVSEEEFTRLQKATQGARGRFPPRRGPGRGLAVDDVVERLLSFDKNKDGKLTKDELPERMHDLIARGDTNKDGALDRDEIRKLAAELARGAGPRRGPPPRFPAPGALTPGAVERALGDLNLSGKKKESAESAVKACKAKVRNLAEMARADLLLQVSAELSAEELKKFKAALDRQPGLVDRPPPPFRRPGPGRGR